MLLARVFEFIARWGGAGVLLGLLIYLFVVYRRAGFIRALRSLFSWGVPLYFLISALFLILIAESVVFIQPQEVGVVISLVAPDGYRDRPLRSGLVVIVPFLEEVKRYPISLQTFTMSAGEGSDAVVARTSDGQEITVDCSTIFQIDSEQVIRFYIDWQDRYITDFVRPVVRGIVRAQASQYKADEINSSKRLDLERDMDKQVREIFQEKGLLVDRFILRNITFSPEYATSITG